MNLFGESQLCFYTVCKISISIGEPVLLGWTCEIMGWLLLEVVVRWELCFISCGISQCKLLMPSRGAIELFLSLVAIHILWFRNPIITM